MQDKLPKMLLDDRKEEGNSVDDMQVDGHEEPVSEEPVSEEPVGKVVARSSTAAAINPAEAAVVRSKGRGNPSPSVTELLAGGNLNLPVAAFMDRTTELFEKICSTTNEAAAAAILDEIIGVRTFNSRLLCGTILEDPNFAAFRPLLLTTGGLQFSDQHGESCVSCAVAHCCAGATIPRQHGRD
jgi:hypothetical protein